MKLPTGPLAISATGAVTALAPTLGGTGETVQPAAPITVNGALNALAPTLGATGMVAAAPITGSGAFTTPAPQFTGTGLLRFIGVGDVSVLGPEVSGSGSMAVPIPAVFGIGALSAQPPIAAGSGSVLEPAPEPPPPENAPSDEEGPWISHGVVHVGHPPLNH